MEVVNDEQKRVLFRKLHEYFDGALEGKNIGLWGLAFKPNTDDMREASSRVLLEELWSAGASVRAYDPAANAEAKRIYGARKDLVLAETAEDALDGADALVIVTEWREFRSPDFERMKSLLKVPVIFDGRNLYDPAVLEQLGIQYFGIGRGRSLVRAAAAERRSVGA